MFGLSSRIPYWFAVRSKFFLPQGSEEEPDPSLILRENLLEEKFFFWYHYRSDPDKSMSLPVIDRKWFIERFVEQREKENQAIESARNRKR